MWSHTTELHHQFSSRDTLKHAKENTLGIRAQIVFVGIINTTLTLSEILDGLNKSLFQSPVVKQCKDYSQVEV